MATTIAKQYTRLLALWPKDALRPNLPFTRAIEHRAAPYGVPPITPVPQDAKPTPSAPAPSTPAPSTPPHPQLEQAQVNALYSLLEDRYSKRYALSPGVLKPTSAPEHYTRLMEEIERAPQKTWWQAKLDEWKMKIRWS
ncbi:Nn.00g050300.m01.CDS01 [Neocucurbitaria sp. VM-36]